MNDDARPFADYQLQAIAASGIGLWHWDVRGQQVRWDERMFEITGADRPIGLDEWMETLTHPDDVARLRQTMATLLTRSGTMPHTVSRIVRPDGEVRHVSATGTIVVGADGALERMFGSLQDVTERERLAERLVEAERMEVLGHLTAGVAHNFNNMLMVIQPALESLAGQVTGQSREEAFDALHAARRAADIVTELMGLAGYENQTERRVFEVEALLRDSIVIFERSMPDRVALELEVEAVGAVESAPGAFEQVLGNLVFNARDALEEAGVAEPRIVVRAADVTEFGDAWVRVSVEDNGPGVPEEVRETLFEPFVTTKKDRGTGLGLASSQAIVQRHGGQLAYRPVPTGGAEFMMLWPRLAPVTPLAAATASSPAPAPASREAPSGYRVLIVDDEPSIVRMLGHGLEKVGGHTVRSADSAQALRALLETAPEIDFVLLDRSLGHEKGAQLVPDLRARLPEAVICFFSGEPVDAAEAALADGVIQKPIALKALHRRIVDALARRP